MEAMGKAGIALATARAKGRAITTRRGVRRGDDRAFELLYVRYQRRITAYVAGMVNDHGRAEDITQEVFISALRRMRATERPIAFQPWIYEIARNACIDAHRRTRRGRGGLLDADDGLSAADPAARRREPGPQPRPSTRRSSSTTCSARSAASRRPTTRSSSCASSRGSATPRSASAWA